MIWVMAKRMAVTMAVIAAILRAKKKKRPSQSVNGGSGPQNDHKGGT